MPESHTILTRGIAAAQHKAIVAEPIINMSATKNRLIQYLSRKLTTPAAGEGYAGDRFDQASLISLFEGFAQLEQIFRVPGNRELVGVFRGEGTG